MAPLTKVQQAQREIERLFDGLPLENQRETVVQLRDRAVKNTVQAATGELFAPVNTESVLASVLSESGSALNVAVATAPTYTGKKRGPKPGSKRNRAVQAQGDVDFPAQNAQAQAPAEPENTDDTQGLIEQICNAHPDGINILGIRDELVAKPNFHTTSQGDNLIALIRNCLNRAKKANKVRHMDRGLYGPAKRRPGRPPINRETVGVGV